MPHRGPLAALVLVFATLAGCATGTAPYVARRAVFHTDAEVLHRAITDAALASGLRVVRDDPARGLLVAISPAEPAGDVPTRDRWRFVVTPGRVVVEMHTEVRDGDAPRPWRRNTAVCDCYRYAREREMIHAIRARVSAAAAAVFDAPRPARTDPDARACALAARPLEP